MLAEGAEGGRERGRDWGAESAEPKEGVPKPPKEGVALGVLGAAEGLPKARVAALEGSLKLKAPAAPNDGAAAPAGRSSERA